MKEISRIEKCFLKNKARIGYLTAGDGGMQRTYDALLALIDGGMNMLEIGIPFSDPIADGPVIQRASQRALLSGTTLEDILWLVKMIRKQHDIPIILFSYLNPILAAQPDSLLRKAKAAGVDGLLLVDCPLEESATMLKLVTKHQLDLIFVITPSTPLDRIQQINQYAQGFLYYACRKGTTGISDSLPAESIARIESIKKIVNLPLVVGFGISNQQMVSNILHSADGAVIGSLFVKALEDGMSFSALTQLAQSLFSK